MKNSQDWKKRFLCWMIIFSMAFGMQFSFAEGSEGTADQPPAVVEVTSEPTAAPTAEPTAVPTAEPTAVPTAEPTAAPTAEPTQEVTAAPQTAEPTQEVTAAPQTAEPTQEVTAAPQTAEPTQAPTAAPQTAEPTQASTAAPQAEEPTAAPATEEPTAEPSREPELVYYTGYAKLTEKTKVYNTENTNTVAYRLPSDSIVYVDHAVLENVERVYVSYSIDAKKAGGFVALSSFRCMTEQQQNDFVRDIKKAGVPAYYDAQKKIPLQEVIPEYPVTATAQPAALPVAQPTAEPTAGKASLGLTKAERNAIIINAMKNKSTTVYNCTTLAQLQSPHSYGSNREDLYVYTNANAAKISFTFSSNTRLEDGYDFIGIFDAKDNLLDTYTGYELAGKTITVTGNTIKIFLLTDYSIQYYGFRVTRIGAYTAPATPAAAAVDSTHVLLSWSASSRISGYSVYRASSPNGTYTYLGDTTGTSYTVAVPYGQLSYFKIRGYSTLGTTKYLSGYSPYRAMYALKTPTIASVTRVDTTQLEVQWRAVGNVEKYQLYHSNSQDGTYSLISTTTATNVTLSLDNTQAHYFKVRAIKTIGGATYYSGFSPIRSGVFSIGQVALNGPAILASSKIKLSWATVPGVTGYQIYRSDSPNGPYTKIGETGAVTYTDTDCFVGQINYYRVRGYIGQLPSRSYGAFSTVRTSFGLGGSPLSISRSGTTTTLTWNDVTNADGYYLYRSPTESNNYVKIATLTATSYDDANADTSWYYRVRPYKIGSNGVTYLGPTSVAKTIGGVGKYRALLISNSYTGTTSALTGTANDSSGMKSMLSRMTQTPYTTNRKTNLTASQMLSQISSTFAGAAENDVSLYYFSGHGANDGSLVGNDFYGVTASQLRARLDTIPGKKIVIIDSCHSGAMIGKAAELTVTTKAQNDAFVSAFISEFSKSGRSLEASDYYVITASSGTQESAEGTVEGTRVGFFTYALCRGAGWDYSKGASTAFPADTNGDRKLSLQEVYRYAYSVAAQYNSSQSAQVWPDNSSFMLFGY